METAPKRHAGEINGSEASTTPVDGLGHKKKRAILSGGGSMGSIYLELQQETGVEFVAVVKSTGELERALEREQCEAVVIASPKQFHVEQVLLATKAGKRVLCEKPLGLSAQDAKTIQDAGATVFGFQRRYDAHFRAAHAQLDSVCAMRIRLVFSHVRKQIGQLQLIRVISRDPPSARLRDAASIIFDSFVHDADLACWFAGARPVSCVSVMTQTGATKTRCASTIEFASGVVALCVCKRALFC